MRKLVQDKHHQRKLQLMPTASASQLQFFALIDVRKTPPAQVVESEDYLVWALVGAGCNDQMQIAQGQGLVRGCALV